MSKEISTLVSSDVTGVFGTPDAFDAVYRELFADASVKLDGVEVIAVDLPLLRPLASFITALEECGFPVVSLHGRPGGTAQTLINRIKTKTANHIVAPTADLVHQYGATREILIHNPEAEIPAVRQALIDHEGHLKRVWIENHLPEVTGLDGAITILHDLRRHGVPAYLMFDPVHRMGERNLRGERFDHAWRDTLTVMRDLLHLADDDTAEPLFAGLHLPIGTNPLDSLPMSQITDTQLTALAEIIHAPQSSVERVVLENQQGSIQQALALFPPQAAGVAQYTTAVLHRLHETGVL